MRLEDLTIVLRPRQPWEAVDLGCCLARRDFGQLLGLWGITVVPIWILLALALHNSPAIFGLVVWWLKPLYDRVPLFFISRAAFGVRPTLSETLKAWPRLWSRFLFSALLLRRFSLIRSFALPIWMLEGQRGKAVRARVRALATDAGSSGTMMTFTFMSLELAVFFGLWILTSYMAPGSGLPQIKDILDYLFSDPDEATLSFLVSPLQQWFLVGLQLVTITLIEIFYVGAGFGLYLNSRIKLEGWDIELTFRKLAARLQPAVVAALVLFTLCVPALAVPAIPNREADSSPPAAVSPKADDTAADDPANTAVKEILAKPEFKIHKQTRKVLDNGDEDTDKDSEGWNGPSFSWVASLLEIFAWLVAAGLIGLLVWWLILNRHIFRFHGLRSRRPEKPKGPRVIMGMDIARESLPDDLLTAARTAWQQGNLREALSLLYRGALSRLVEQRRLPIRDSDTEDDCLIHVAKSGERIITDYFRQLTMLWVRAAYAGIEAGTDEFDHLCRSWPFDRPTPGKSPKAAAVFRIVWLGLSLLVITGCKYKDVETITGYKGKARSDPFLAAQQLLQEFDHETEKLNILKKLPDAETNVLVLSGESGMSEGRARQLLDWVQEGGHLVYALAGCKPYNDWSLFAGIGNYAYFGNEDRQDALLKSLNVDTSDRRKEADKAKPERKLDPKKKSESKKEKKKTEEKIETPEDVSTRADEVHWGARTYRVEMPDYVTFKLDRKLRTGEFAAGTVEKATILGLRRGEGRVTLLNHARPLRNRYLGDKDHAAWLVDLMGEEYRDVQFVVSMEGSLWNLLWEKAWMVLLGLAVVVAFWLWHHLPRFGPVRHVELHETKHFAEHVSALGQFFHGLRRNDILLTAAADAVRARALRRFPQLHSGGDAALLPILVERSGLSEARVQAALSPAASSQPHHLVRLLLDLQTLRQALA